MKFLLTTILYFFSALHCQAGSVDVAKMKSLADATHLEIAGLPEWRYEVKRQIAGGKSHVIVQFAGVESQDLSVLKSLKDKRVERVEISDGVNNSALVDFTLAESTVNMFDYQTEDPAHLVLDFYKDEVVKAKTALVKQDISSLVQKKKPSKKMLRSIASLENPDVTLNQPALLSSSPALKNQKDLNSGIFDGGDKDLKRFKIESPELSETELIRSTQNIYVHFPELIVREPSLEKILKEKPDLEIPAANTDENLQARLAIKLFKEGKFAVALRTLKFFVEKNPNSQFDSILENLKAEIYYGLWVRDHNRVDLEQALALYKELLNKYPQDPSRYRILMIIGFSYLEIGNYFGALSTFQVGVRSYPDSPYYWEMRLGIADSLRSLNKFHDALSELGEIESEPKSDRFGVQAGFQQGDVYFHSKDYTSAIHEYRRVATKFENYSKDAPNIFFNLAEAQFWLKDYKSSLESFREFLQRFPSNSFGGYAMTRLGEIMELLGAPKQKVTGAYLESYFRFRDTPGAYLAKVHINSSRFSLMKPKELEAVQKEDVSEMPKGIDGIDAFVKLQESDGFFSRKEFEKGRAILTKFVQENPTSSYLDIYKNRISKNLTREIENQNENKNYVGALENYLKNSEKWLLKNGRVDTRYFVAKAYEALNVPDDSIHLYKECLKEISSFPARELRTLAVFEELPTADQINLRLAKVYSLADDYKSSAEFLNSIKKPFELTSTEQIERTLLIAKVAEKQEKYEVAIGALKNLTEAWRGDFTLLSEPWLKLAELYEHLGKTTSSLEYTAKIIENVKRGSGAIVPKIARDALELSANLNLSKGNQVQAIKDLSLILEKFGDENSSLPTRYKLGKIYFDQKNLREASKTWAPLKDSFGGELYAKMAKDNLASSQWSTKYDRYLDRKPAGEKK